VPARNERSFLQGGSAGGRWSTRNAQRMMSLFSVALRCPA
jgi:hypothetical protein